MFKHDKLKSDCAWLTKLRVSISSTRCIIFIIFQTREITWSVTVSSHSWRPIDRSQPRGAYSRICFGILLLSTLLTWSLQLCPCLPMYSNTGSVLNSFYYFPISFAGFFLTNRCKPHKPHFCCSNSDFIILPTGKCLASIGQYWSSRDFINFIRVCFCTNCGFITDLIMPSTFINLIIRFGMSASCVQDKEYPR